MKLSFYPLGFVVGHRLEICPIATRLWSFINDLETPFTFRNRLTEHGEQIRPDVWYNRCDGDFSIANVFEQLIRHDANVPDGAIWGDKSPSYLHHIESIRAIYPTAKFIHLIRDARDYVLSLEKHLAKTNCAQHSDGTMR